MATSPDAEPYFFVAFDNGGGVVGGDIMDYISGASIEADPICLGM